MRNGNGRLLAIDGLRGLSCIPIVICHGFLGGNEALVNAIAGVPGGFIISLLHNYGGKFVCMFFLLSGYCTFMHYENKEWSIPKFLFGRMKKLYPLCFISISVGIILAAIDVKFFDGTIVEKQVNMWNIIKSYTLTHTGWVENSGVTPYGSGMWFVNALFLCYIIYGFIHNYIAERYRNIIYIIFVFLGWICIDRELTLPFLSAGDAYMCFFLGILLYKFEKEITSTKIINALLVLEVIGYGVCIILGAGGPPADLFCGLVLFPTIILATLKNEWLSRFLSIRPIQFMGKISTAVYMTHVLTLYVVAMVLTTLNKTYLYNDLRAQLVFFIIYMVVAIISYYLIEKPVMNKVGTMHFSIED